MKEITQEQIETKTTITTDNKWREFRYRYEVPEKVLDSEFDWLDKDVDDGFIYYKKRWYHLNEFMLSSHFTDWNGYHSDSFFSGTLIKVSKDCDEFKIGTYVS